MASDDAARREVAAFEALAEKAYDDMYESRAPAGCYSDLKDYFAQAIGAAQRSGMTEDASRLQQRLDHCIAVFRSQFPPS